MKCDDLQRELPDIIEGCRTAEQELHLRSCRECSGLLADLEHISREARLLQASEEPSPRLWNTIEATLRREGLIHEPRPEPAVGWIQRWNAGWMLPLAAAFLLTVGVVRYRMQPSPQGATAQNPTAPLVTASLHSPDAAPASADDDQVLEEVSARAPALRASYQADLRDVNAYIHDAEESAHAHPNDEEAQQYLMDAYEQKAMVYEMALDRSLP